MSNHWRAWLALGLVVAGLAVALSDRYVRPTVGGTVLAVPLGHAEKLEIHVWPPPPTLDVTILRWRVRSSEKVLAFSVRTSPWNVAWCVAMCVVATGLMVSDRLFGRPRQQQADGEQLGVERE